MNDSAGEGSLLLVEQFNLVFDESADRVASGLFHKRRASEELNKLISPPQSILRHQLLTLVVFGVVVPLVALGTQSPVELVLGEVGPGGVGVSSDHFLQ